MRFSDNGRMAYEELFGREGFSGPSSLIYHRNLPEGAKDVSEGPADLMTPEHEQVHTNAHLKGFDLPSQGDMITGRRWLLVNDDVHIGLVAPVTKGRAEGGETARLPAFGGAAPTLQRI